MSRVHGACTQGKFALSFHRGKAQRLQAIKIAPAMPDQKAHIFITFEGVGFFISSEYQGLD